MLQCAPGRDGKCTWLPARVTHLHMLFCRNKANTQPPAQDEQKQAWHLMGHSCMSTGMFPSSSHQTSCRRPRHLLYHAARSAGRPLIRCWSCQDSIRTKPAVAEQPWPARAILYTYGTLCSLAVPSVATAWPWDAQQPIAVPLPSSNFPFAVPFGVDYLLGHPFVTIALAAGLYVIVPRLWRFVVRVIVVPVLAIAALGFALQHPAATLSFGSAAFGCESVRQTRGSPACTFAFCKLQDVDHIGSNMDTTYHLHRYKYG